MWKQITDMLCDWLCGWEDVYARNGPGGGNAPFNQQPRDDRGRVRGGLTVQLMLR